MAQRRELPFPRLFEDFEDNYDEVFTPAVESYVKDGNLVVRADVPGLELKDLEVTILGNVLSVKGERKNKQEVKRDDYLRREISYGAFERRMSLPKEQPPTGSKPASRTE
jgi:HSP20 family protein